MNPLVPEALSTNCATMNCVKIEDVEALQELLRNEGYNVHLAELKGATDETEIFLRIAACLPYGAAYISLHKKINLDALADMLYSGVWEEGKVALVITNANDLVENHINLMFGLLVNFQSNRHHEFSRQDNNFSGRHRAKFRLINCLKVL